MTKCTGPADWARDFVVWDVFDGFDGPAEATCVDLGDVDPCASGFIVKEFDKFVCMIPPGFHRGLGV